MISKFCDFEILPLLDVFFLYLCMKIDVACWILKLQDSFLTFKPNFTRSYDVGLILDCALFQEAKKEGGRRQGGN